MVIESLDDVKDAGEKVGKKQKWVEDEMVFDDDGEVVKLQVGESIEGLLVDKKPSVKYSTQIYKIKVKDDDIPKVILGTTILDRLMAGKEVGKPVRIERLADGSTTKGKPLQNWKTYHLE